MTGQPIDRVHFLDEQRTNRRRSRRFVVFAIVAVALSGIPLCVIVAPLLIGVIIVAMHVADFAAPLSPAMWDRLHDVVFALPALWGFVRGRPVDANWASVAIIYIVPGAVLMLLSWPLMLALARRAGAGAIMHRLPSRDLELAVLHERQLANVTEEMAIAAGVRPPRVRVMESDAVNAVAVGLTSDDSTIIATTGFLNRLDRDERQAIVAHLVGSVGNGDLEIGAVILSVFATWGLISLLLEAPFSARRRTMLRRILRLMLDNARGRAHSREAEEVFEILLAGASWDMSMIDDIYDIHPRSALHGCAIIVVQIPVIAVLGLASITARMSAALFTALGLGPWLAAMWRARRRLADASAVQLTRNPTALARAVRTLDGCDVVVPGGWVAYFLFPVWAPVTANNATQTEAASNIVGMRLETEPRVESVVALGAMLDTDVRRPGLITRLRRLGTWKDFRIAVGWGAVGIVMSVVLITVTLAAASVILMVLWGAARFLNPRR
jgi:Zn-dependent protease with chaperone function